MDYTMQGFYDSRLDISRRLFGRFKPLYPARQSPHSVPREVRNSHKTIPPSDSSEGVQQINLASLGFYPVDEVCKH